MTELAEQVSMPEGQQRRGGYVPPHIRNGGGRRGDSAPRGGFNNGGGRGGFFRNNGDRGGFGFVVPQFEFIIINTAISKNT